MPWGGWIHGIPAAASRDERCLCSTVCPERTQSRRISRINAPTMAHTHASNLTLAVFVLWAMSCLAEILERDIFYPLLPFFPPPCFASNSRCSKSKRGARFRNEAGSNGKKRRLYSSASPKEGKRKRRTIDSAKARGRGDAQHATSNQVPESLTMARRWQQVSETHAQWEKNATPRRNQKKFPSACIELFFAGGRLRRVALLHRQKLASLQKRH